MRAGGGRLSICEGEMRPKQGACVRVRVRVGGTAPERHSAMNDDELLKRI